MGIYLWLSAASMVLALAPLVDAVVELGRRKAYDRIDAWVFRGPGQLACALFIIVSGFVERTPDTHRDRLVSCTSLGFAFVICVILWAGPLNDAPLRARLTLLAGGVMGLFNAVALLQL
jgi:hypothetical protein